MIVSLLCAARRIPTIPRPARALYIGRRLLGPIGRRVLPALLNPDRRWHIRPDLTAEQFFGELRRRGVAYAVLRGVEELGSSDQAGRLDLLVADQHLSALQDLLSIWPLGRPCSAYSTTGVPGFAYRRSRDPERTFDEVAAFPPHLAERILQRAGLLDCGVAVPSPEDRLFALAYRAIYLEGTASGLPSEDGAAPDSGAASIAHDYTDVLSDLAAGLGVELPRPMTMEALDEFLARAGWQPPHDVLERLSVWHPWIARKHFPAVIDGETDAPGFTVFFLRQRAIETGHAPFIADLIECKGFEILASLSLEGGRRDEVARTVRGGNWGQGPWPVSGGEPGIVLVAFDVIPLAVGAAERARYPKLDNARILHVKEAVRGLINDELLPHLRYNPIHSTDNSRAAWHVVNDLLADQKPMLRDAIRRRRDALATREEVLADLTQYGNRARVELIRWGDVLAVKKTFRANAMRFLENEVAFYERFSTERPEVLPVLGRGDNYFILPFFPHQAAQPGFFGGRLPRLMPLDAARQLVGFVKHLLDRGYDPVDLAPIKNTLIGRNGRIRVIDFEFVYRHRYAPVRPEKSFCFAGVPNGFDGDAPARVAYLRDPYPTLWYPSVGLSMGSLLHDPRWLQRLKRSIYHPRRLVLWALRASIFSERVGALSVARRWYRRLAH
jgi:hypothetical protein